MMLRLSFLFFVLAFAEDFEEVALGGVEAARDVTTDEIELWNNAVQRFDDEINCYGNSELLKFNDPVKVRTQVVAGTNYEFIFEDEAKVTVWSQPWTDLLRITNIVPSSENKVSCGSSSSSSESEEDDGDDTGDDDSQTNFLGAARGGVSTENEVSEEHLEVWQQVLDKFDEDDHNTKLYLTNLGQPTSVQTQVVSGMNYFFTFADETKITVYSQSWTNTLKITKISPTTEIKEGESVESRRRLINSAMGGGWTNARDLTDADELIWSSALQVSESEYNYKNLGALGTPMKVSTQTVAGINYDFIFQDGTTVRVFVQSWTNTIQISQVDGKAAFATYSAEAPVGQMVAGGATQFRAVEQSDLDIWNSALEKSHTEYNHVMLSSLGAPVKVSTQVVAGVNYLFKFSDGTVIKVFVQSWTDTLQISEVNNVQALETCPGNQKILDCKPACPNKCGQGPGLCMAVICRRGCGCPSGLWEKAENCVHVSQCDDVEPQN